MRQNGDERLYDAAWLVAMSASNLDEFNNQGRSPDNTVRSTLPNCVGAKVADGEMSGRLQQDLGEAIRRQELSLYYQPQFDIRSGQVCGVEALARWFRGVGDTVSPAVFIPLAERTGMIYELGKWALESACHEARQWRETIPAAPLVAVNVSPLQICGQFTADIVNALIASGLPAERLELEITESMLLSNNQLVWDCLNHWRKLGVRIALDDFGSGYSSIGYLARLPIDRLKIDASLIRGMTAGSKDTAIVRNVIALGRELGVTVIAEGVETEQQLGLLEDLGCHQAQGYLFAFPSCASEACERSRRPWGDRAALPAQRSIW